MLLTTGQIIFFAGLAGLACALAATILTVRAYRRNEKKLREEIWREYR